MGCIIVSKFEIVIISIIVCWIGLFLVGTFCGELKNFLGGFSALQKTEIVSDTIKVKIIVKDTVYVSIIDTVEYITSDTVVVEDVAHVYHYPTLVDYTEQPLFNLRLEANTRTNQIMYDFDYKPLLLELRFCNKHDLRKGFEVSTIPTIDNIAVDWGEYKPLRRPWGIAVTVGTLYCAQTGLAPIAGIQVKRIQVGGVFTAQGNYGVYLQYNILTF